MKKSKTSKHINYIGGDTANGGIVTVQFSRNLTYEEFIRLEELLRYDFSELLNGK